MPQCVLGNIVTALIAEVFSAKMPAFILYALYTLFYFILIYLLICFCCCWQTVKAHINSVAVNNCNSPTIQQQLCAWMCRYSRRSANIHITVWWTCVCVFCGCFAINSPAKVPKWGAPTTSDRQTNWATTKGNCVTTTVIFGHRHHNYLCQY